MGIIEQGVFVVTSYANDERAVAQTIQQNISQAINQLNQEGKRVIKISFGPSVQFLLGVNHISYLLWEIPKEAHIEQPKQFNTLSITTDNVDSLLDTVSREISEGNFEKAENYCSQILDYFPHNPRANILRLLIENRVFSIGHLVNTKPEKSIIDSPYFIVAKKSENISSCPEYTQIITKLEERKENRNNRISEERIQSPEEMKQFLANDDVQAEEALVDFVLEDVGENTQKVNYEIHYLTGLRLFECAELIRSLPVTLLNDIPITKATALKKRMENAGATIAFREKKRV